MKFLLACLVLWPALLCMAQESQTFKPVFIVDREMVSQEEVEKLARNGWVKTMHNGVNDETFSELQKLHGDA